MQMLAELFGYRTYLLKVGFLEKEYLQKQLAHIRRLETKCSSTNFKNRLRISSTGFITHERGANPRISNHGRYFQYNCFLCYYTLFYKENIF
jgi:hypothetical protein